MHINLNIPTHQDLIARELQLKTDQVKSVTSLLDEGGTVPFIARYRKEATGLLNEIQITAIRDRLLQLAELDKRRKTIITSLTERNLLNPTLEKAILAAPNMTVLEDVYLPHRRKRITRSLIAQEKGLEPLARTIFQQDTPLKTRDFINTSKGVRNSEEALAGARDIIAEWVSEDPAVRSGLRRIFSQKSIIISKVVKKNQEAGAKFKDYFDWQEAATKAAGHRLLAMLRGESEKVLRLTIRPPQETALEFLTQKYAKSGGAVTEQLSLALVDSYKRLLRPSLENELRAKLKEQADREAIKVFVDNLRDLLLASPLGHKRVLALDPGFRTGAKLVCLDAQGQLLHFTTIFPTHSAAKKHAK